MTRVTFAFAVFVAGCAAPREKTAGRIPETELKLRIVQRSLGELDLAASGLIPKGGSYIAFERVREPSEAPVIETSECRLIIETSAASLEPGKECTVRVRLEGGTPGARYRIELLAPSQVSVLGPASFTLRPGEERSIRIVSHARTTARVLARVHREVGQ